MPDEIYHIEKRDRFRNSADYLEASNRVFSYDPTVQDYFYSAMHEAERFLARLGLHSRSHGQRENFVTNYMIQTRGKIVNRAQFSKNPRQPSEPLFDGASEGNYMLLCTLRLNLVYGNDKLGQLRHANQRDVRRAKQYLIGLLSALNRHEQNLRHRGII